MQSETNQFGTHHKTKSSQKRKMRACRCFVRSFFLCGSSATAQSHLCYELLRFFCVVHYGAGDVGDGDIGGGSGGDGARASEGRSLVLNACPASGLLSLVRVRVRARVRTGVRALGLGLGLGFGLGFGLGLGARVRVRVICAEDRTGY